MSEEEQTYYVTTSKSRNNKFKLHTDRDCMVLQQSNGVREARDYEIEYNEVCKHCTGDVDTSRKDSESNLHRKITGLWDDES